MEQVSEGFIAVLEQGFARFLVQPIIGVLFFDLWFWDNGQPDDVKLPLVVTWLVMGALFFTLRFAFINIRGFQHAIACVRGHYTHPEDAGEISHFQALSAALSATVGLGNIAGVAVAIGAGGPGATFWMILAGFLGMSSKFAECTLGQKYRVAREDGHVSGGPMHYLRDGLAELGSAGRTLGTVLAPLFAFMCIGASLGGGNMFQANQSFAQVANVMELSPDGPGAAIYGVVLAVFVGAVIIGGIRRIGQVAGVMVPVMCGVYVVCGLVILMLNAAEIPGALGVIVSGAFTPEGIQGGLIGVLIQGFQRAAFSNEAGVGSASIAHSAASTNEPIREGMVALLEPFIDTIVVCTMTALVVVVTGAYDPASGAGSGIEMTSWAFGREISWFPTILSVTAVLFAFSTMISWSYYGEQCWAELFGTRAILAYKLLFLVFVWIGSVFPLSTVIDFSDGMLLGMSLPNILGVMLLSGKIRSDLNSYLDRLERGEIQAVI